MSSTLVRMALAVLDGRNHRDIPRYGSMMKGGPDNVAIDEAALAHEERIRAKQEAWLQKRGLE